MRESGSELVRDQRKIARISSAVACEEYGWSARSGHDDRIEAYEEPGERDWVPWFRVIKNGEVVARVPAATFIAEYATPAPAEREG